MVSPKWLEPKRLSAKQALRAAGLGAHIGGLPSQASQELNALGPEQAVTRRPSQPRPAQPCMDESADSREEGGREAGRKGGRQEGRWETDRGEKEGSGHGNRRCRG